MPVCFALGRDTVYSAVDHKPKRSRHLRRIANIEATGSACLLVDAYDEDWTRLWWVRLDGRGRVVADRAESERALAALVAKYPQYGDLPRTIPPNYAGAAFPELANNPLSHTLSNMTLAMSGQKLTTPQDEAMAQKGKLAGFQSAATTAGITLGGELLLAPRAVQVLSKVPAGRDPLTGRMLPWVTKAAATEEGSSLAKAGFDALKAAGEAHPLVKQMIISGLGALGAGKIAHALGWIGKAVE